MSETESTDATDRATPEMGPIRLEVEVHEPDRFLSLVRAVDSLTDKIRLEFAPDAVRIRTFNQQHTALADIEFAAVSYNTDLNGAVTVGVDIAELVSEAASTFYKGELSFQLHSDSKDLTVHHSNTMAYVGLYDPASVGEPDESKVSLSTTVEANVRELKAAAGSVSGASPGAVRFQVDEHGFAVSSLTTGAGSVFRAPRDFPVEGEQAATAVDSDTLWGILGSLYPAGDLELRFGEQYPLEIETDHALFRIAPRLLEDDR